MALNRPRDPLVFLNFLVDLLGSRLLPSMSVELPAGVAALQLLPSMSVELTADVAAWVLRYQLPAGGLVSAGSNILVALLCFLGCFFGSFLGCFLARLHFVLCPPWICGWLPARCPQPFRVVPGGAARPSGCVLARRAAVLWVAP